MDFQETDFSVVYCGLASGAMCCCGISSPAGCTEAACREGVGTLLPDLQPNRPLAATRANYCLVCSFTTPYRKYTAQTGLSCRDSREFNEHGNWQASISGKGPKSDRENRK